MKYLPQIIGVTSFVAGVALVIVVTSESTPSATDRFSGGGGDGYSFTKTAVLPAETFVSPPRFSGGGFDGHAQVAFLVNPIIIQPFPKRFSGGALDGFGQQRLGIIDEPPPASSPRFSGGHHDGYAVLTVSFGSFESISGSARFSGGPEDGFAYSALFTSGSSQLIDSKRFWGGASGGYASVAFFASGGSWQLSSPRFQGGYGDGYFVSGLRIPSVVIQLDSDGDGIPDWWETMYFGGATSANPNSPVDASGMTALEKYIAGLTPGDPNSVFVISSVDEMSVVAEDPCMTFTWPTVPGRVYRVYANRDLNRDWPKVPAAEYFGDGKPVSFIHCDDGSIPLYFRLTVDFIAQ